MLSIRLAKGGGEFEGGEGDEKYVSHPITEKRGGAQGASVHTAPRGEGKDFKKERSRPTRWELDACDAAGWEPFRTSFVQEKAPSGGGEGEKARAHHRRHPYLRGKEVKCRGIR